MATFSQWLYLLAMAATVSASPSAADNANAVHLESQVWSYSFEELRQRAYAFHQLTLGKGPEEDRAFFEQLLMAGEFRGYIAAALDEAGNAPSINQCAKRVDLTHIAARVSSLILALPNDGSRNAWFAARSALLRECSK